MARITKKIKKKLAPKPSEQSKPKEKVGKDYLLIGVIAFTFIVMVAGWPTISNMNRALYFTLLLSLSMTYAQRHYDLNEIQEIWVRRIGTASMGFAVALFMLTLYYQFIAS
ncbi:MAG: hypothetical protein IJ668_10595 [Selenomonadaceae bacterium]|nr:hypothetical protein [Selenomonadaceae bacterium]MBR1580917.1 hypothetical protein [Selenomonadaceae bacterium]